ncbi:MAG: hypothetical protein EBY32_16975 [Proteobacteria bacterium]|nr:hypothetical protein [Pseudomonadota bacterium]
MEGHPPAWPKFPHGRRKTAFRRHLAKYRTNYAMRPRGRDYHATLGRRCAAEKWVMRDDDPPIRTRRAFARGF